MAITLMEEHEDLEWNGKSAVIDRHLRTRINDIKIWNQLKYAEITSRAQDWLYLSYYNFDIAAEKAWERFNISNKPSTHGWQPFFFFF